MGFILVYESMKDHMERLVVLPFSVDCISLSSDVASATTQSKKSDQESNYVVTRRKEADERPTRVKRKTSWGLLALLRSFISRGIHKLINSFKCFSQLFVYSGEIEDTEMKIGFPTDVKHVTHIGWDGSMSSNPVKGWENLKTSELLSFPSISLRQFELAMASQAEALVGLRS